MYSDLFWDHDQLLSCWAWSTVTFEGKGLTYSPLVSYVFSVLHTELHTPVSIYFYETTSECWRHSRVVPTAYRGERDGLSPFICARKRMPRIDGQHSGSSVSFFFSSIWYDGTSRYKSSRHPDISSRSYHSRHGTPVRFVRLFTESEHTLDRTSLKKNVSLAFPCRDAFLTLARTVRRRNRIVPILSRDKPQLQWLGQSMVKGP